MHRADDGFALDTRLAADTQPVGDLPLSRVLLMNDARFPWLILVPRRAELRELTDLEADDRRVLSDEIDRCARALQALEHPDKLNIAALGNVVAQLHVHIVARRRNDAAWPRPVWGSGNMHAYATADLTAKLDRLRERLGTTSA